ncbi:hypothetical protein PM10SUCC1_18640 [Propionigenium maris DSM 9537]|uniref:DUF2141 domain-containing protein n=1 Tax=Propionigenium maris DSM 9537 TaxID=1123000 RepID=A0A9W6GLI0_9FUSO|nr:DUF2141 domain-containing protein [Propionigenium maris]GLI56350.1 hypothetical protein PM10SUCC1_18640 [Propionigenium maris DSM 9537]
MVRRILILSAVLILSLDLFPFTIRVRGIEDRGAPIYLLVFAAEEGFPDDREGGVFSYMATPAEAEGGIEIPLEEGRYAVTLFQDINGDSRLNKWFFGKPREPYGVSGARRRPLRSPNFENSCINFKSGKTFYIELWQP